MNRWPIFFMLVCASHLLVAQSDNPSEPLSFTLQECIDYAIRHNINVRQSEWSVVGDQVALRQSKADLFPSINAGTSFSYNVGRTINPFTNEYVEQPISQQNLNLGANLVLFNGLRKLNTIKQNKANVAVSQLDLEATKNNITLNVINAYTQILFNQELLETRQFQRLTSQDQFNRTQRLVEAGSLPEADALEADAQVAQDEVGIIEAENNLALAKLQLKQLLQLPDSQPLNIVLPEIAVPDTVMLPDSPSAVYAQAVNTLPAIKSADLQITSAQYGLSIARADFYPSISLDAGLVSRYSSVAPDQIPKAGVENNEREVPTGNFIRDANGTLIPVLTVTNVPTAFTENTYLNQLDFNLNRYVGINLNIPIFNNWQARTGTARARINWEQAKLNALDQRNILRQNIEQAYLDAKSAAKSYAANQRQVTSLTQAFKNTEVRYQAGALDAVSYNQAKNNLDAAESNLVQAKYNYIFSLKVLDFYQGKSLEFR